MSAKQFPHLLITLHCADCALGSAVKNRKQICVRFLKCTSTANSTTYITYVFFYIYSAGMLLSHVHSMIVYLHITFILSYTIRYMFNTAGCQGPMLTNGLKPDATTRGSWIISSLGHSFMDVHRSSGWWFQPP